ncbi:HAMP domain-containing histidine kinase [Nocardioides sp. TF02-7]|nr:HAMP domain-containing histidine kinase [Nocardioides sp. TF02-7]
MQRSLDDSLLERARGAAKADVLREADVPSWALGAADVRIAFIYADRPGRTLDDGPDIVLGEPEHEVALGESSSSIRTIRIAGDRYRVVTVPTREPGTALVIAQSLADQDRILARLGWVTVAFGGMGVLTAALAGWAVATNGLRPVRQLTTAVERIARTEDLTPLPVEGDDEVARLATAFNHMLTALDASRIRQRQLVADASHELRTPLTSLRTNIDLLTMSGDDASTLPPGARAELMEDIRAQIEELTTLIGDLTELARDEPVPHQVEPVDLGEVIDHAVQRVRRRAPGLTFEVFTRPWWVVGEAPSLERAVTNLLDNAAKWSPPDGRVTVRLSDGVLTVDDQGPGIPEPDRARIFDRFWRSDDSRTLPGVGAGPRDRAAGDRASRRHGAGHRQRRRRRAAGAQAARNGEARCVTRSRASGARSPRWRCRGCSWPAAAARSSARSRTCPTRRPRSGTPATRSTRGSSSGCSVRRPPRSPGTPTAPECRFRPDGDSGEPVVTSSYLLWPGTLEDAWETMGQPADADVSEPRIPGADAARVVVDVVERQLYVTGFVQNGDLIQNVNVVDPAPFDRQRVVAGVRSVLTVLSEHALESGVDVTDGAEDDASAPPPPVTLSPQRARRAAARPSTASRRAPRRGRTAR